MADALDTYLRSVPCDLSASRFQAWRERNPPPYVGLENRRGRACGVCGGPLGPMTRFCHSCHSRELEAARR